MDDRKSVSILILFFFVALAVMIGGGAFWLGRQSTNNLPDGESVAAALSSPSPAARAKPPRIVTNTPTATPSPSPTPTSAPTVTLTPTNTPTPIVVIDRVNALGRLETTEYVMRTVVDLENEAGNLWEQIFGSDKLMLMAEGEVVAGFDLEEIGPDDITVKGTVVRIILPAPKILYSRIDNQKTQVYERRTGLFVRPDQTLESQARQLAEEALTAWAIDRGIFEDAEKQGKIRIENLLRSLGFTNITVEIKEPDL